MRKYCIGAFLLDRDDPSKVIGRLARASAQAQRERTRRLRAERRLYLRRPSHQGELIIPYGLADHATGFATVPLDEVLAAMQLPMTIPDKRVAILSPVAWRTPPRQYGAWETVASNITEGLAARGWDVTLFATQDSVTRARLHAVIDRGYEEDSTVDPKVAEYLHISEAFEHAAEFDLIHSHYDFMALTYSRLVKTPVLTTIHGFSSPKIMPVYQKYRDGYFVSISDSDRAPGTELSGDRVQRDRPVALSISGIGGRRAGFPGPNPSRQRRPSGDRRCSTERPASAHRGNHPRQGIFREAGGTLSRRSRDSLYRTSRRGGQKRIVLAGPRATASEHHPGTIRPGAGGSQCRWRARDRDGPGLLPRSNRRRKDRISCQWRQRGRGGLETSSHHRSRGLPQARSELLFRRNHGAGVRASLLHDL